MFDMFMVLCNAAGDVVSKVVVIPRDERTWNDGHRGLLERETEDNNSAHDTNV